MTKSLHAKFYKAKIPHNRLLFINYGSIANKTPASEKMEQRYDLRNQFYNMNKNEQDSKLLTTGKYGSKYRHAGQHLYCNE